ncbi:MAG: citrate lyase acyl carrier protein [Fusobacteriaceae bacterium]
MEIKKIANAGTLESSDIQIVIAPSETGIEIQLESAVMAQFGDSINEVIMDTLKEMGVTSAKVNANDKGAIDSVIKSRVQTAVMRAAEQKNFKW